MAESNSSTPSFNIKHGHTRNRRKSPEYQSWYNMLCRCRNANNTHYDRYGGRGISVCERWLSFENFLSDMGNRPTLKHTLERIDNDGNYEPSNCRWATRKEQSQNTCSTKMLTFNGKTMCVSDWMKELGMSSGALRHRLSNGWSVEQALTTPVQERDTVLTYNGKAMRVAEWANELGIRRDILDKRLKQGWSVEKALTTQVRSHNRPLTYNGQTCSLSEWSEKTGISYDTLKRRLRTYGWSIEKAMTTPVLSMKHHKRRSSK